MIRSFSIFLFTLFIASCSDNTEINSTEQLINEHESINLENTYDTVITEKGSQVSIQYFENDTMTIERTFEPLTEKIFYGTGELKERIEFNDEGYGFKYTIYHKNGKVKTRGEQGEFAGCGIQIGVEMNYDTKGILIQEKSFEHFLPDDANGCHETVIITSVIDYFSNGKIKQKSQIESCYECEECPCGKWQIYDEDGNLIEVNNYEDCYDFRLDCVLDE